MVKRLWFVLCVIWAGLVFAAGLMPGADGSPSDNSTSKVVILALFPILIGAVLGPVAHWVRHGNRPASTPTPPKLP